MLWRALGDVEHGCYVDVGAADPDIDSVTKALYERGWRGVNIEPNPEFAARLRERRPGDITVEACAGSAEGQAILHLVEGTGLSTLVSGSLAAVAEGEFEIRDVPTIVRRLDTILDDCGVTARDIHVLKVDVEGFERDVLEGIDLTRIRPWVIVVESTAPRSREPVHEIWEPLLTEASYEYCLFDGLNRFYVAREHIDRQPLLSSPVSVFDQPYATPEHWKLLVEIDALRQGNGDNSYAHQRRLEDSALTQARLDRAVSDYQRLEALYETTVADYQRVEALYVESRAERDAAIGEVTALRADLATLRSGVHRMAQDRLAALAERDAALQHVAALQQTRSWRITHPFRAVSSRIAHR